MIMQIINLANECETYKDAVVTNISDSGKTKSSVETVICEHYIKILINGLPVFTLACTPQDLSELVIGRLLTEQIVTKLEEIEKLYICAKGNLAEVRLSKNIQLHSADPFIADCCTENKQFLSSSDKTTLRRLPAVSVSPETVFELASGVKKDTALHKLTGGTHSCSIRTSDGTVKSFEDIGRHNALDKAVGYMFLNKINPAECMLFTTGRTSSDMARKTIAAGIPVLISKAVPTTEALKLAQEYGLRLICRAWPDSYKQYLLRN